MVGIKRHGPVAAAVFCYGVMLVWVYTWFAPAVLSDPMSITRDDGRHFVVWLRALADPTLFPDDPIADYFRNLTPIVFEALHWPSVVLGIDVMAWNLLVVVPLTLGVGVLAAYTLIAAIFSDPFQRIGVLCVTLLSVSWSMAEGLPRSFNAPIVFGALAAYLWRKPIALSFILAFGANMYPAAAVTALAAIGTAGLFGWARFQRFSAAEPLLTGVSILATAAGLLLFLAGANSAGDTVLLEEARSLPIFQAQGRTSFFLESQFDFWVCGHRSGVLRNCFALGSGPALAIYAFALIAGGVLIGRSSASHRAKSALLALFIGGGILFFVAHLIAFNAHLPSRYTIASLAVLFPLTLGAVTTALAVAKQRAVRRFGQAACLFLIIVFAGFVLLTDRRPYLQDDYPEVTNTLRDLPTDTRVAGFHWMTDSVPAYAARSVYVSWELTVPYKRDYLAEMEARAGALDRLYRGPVDAEWHRLLDDSGIDVFLASPSDAQFWARMDMSFEQVTAPPRRTVFETHLRVAVPCMIASANGVFSTRDAVFAIDAACFAEAMRTDN